MSTGIITISFQTQELSEGDELNSKIVNALNKIRLQNLQAFTANQKLNMKFDPEQVVQYAQNQAYLDGKLELLQQLLDDSTDAENYLKAALQEHVENSSNSSSY